MSRRRIRRPALLIAGLIVATAGCAEPEAEGPDDPPTQAASEPAAPQRLDPLRITLEFETTSVEAGAELPSRMTVTNPTNRTVVDPRCLIGSGRYALVPIDDPDAELWVQPVVDCAGPQRMKPGFRDTWDGPAFFAHTKFGDPLPAGEYLAVLSIPGRSDRLEYPVTVEQRADQG